MPTPMIAVVEDDPSMRKAIQRIVRGLGFLVGPYESAEAFLDDEATGSTSCLILDLHLGGMSSLDLTNALVVKGHRYPVICVTGMELTSWQRDPQNLGCAAYLPKPFEADSPVEAIRRAVEDP